MPTPPLNPSHRDWPEVEKAWKVYHDEWGEKLGAIKAAAEAVGRHQNTVSGWLETYRRHLSASPGQREAAAHASLDLAQATHGWRVIKHEDGSRDSVFWKAPELPDDTLQRIRAAFEGMKPARPITPPERVLDDLCTVFPVFDMHFGMHAWGDETGGDHYDTKRAAADLEYATEKVLALTPAAKQAVIIFGGDTLHADDNQHQTPRNGHALDVDGRHYRVIERCIKSLSRLIERVLQRSENVTIRVLRGNHDEHSHMVLTFALAERYREEPRITVDKAPLDLFMLQWGRCSVFAHHGDKAKPERMALQVADICPFWSDTRHRYAFTGHVHHDQARDIGGLRWESLRAFCPPDAYAAGMGYTARRAMQALTFDKTDGLVLRALDPIERAA